MQSSRAVHRRIHRVKTFESCLEKCSKTLSNVPNPNRHYVAWVNLSQHYSTSLPSNRVQVFRNGKSRRIIASTRLSIGLPSPESLRATKHHRSVPIQGAIATRLNINLHFHIRKTRREQFRLKPALNPLLPPTLRSKTPNVDIVQVRLLLSPLLVNQP